MNLTEEIQKYRSMLSEKKVDEANSDNFIPRSYQEIRGQQTHQTTLPSRV